jgi:flagellar motility protein MotE (MotC chaperone)
MVDTYLVRSLKQVHDECERALREDNYQVNNSLADRFNELLDDFKHEYPDDERIQGIDECEGVNVTGRHAATNQSRALDLIQDIKLKTLQIADLLDLDTGDFEELSSSGEFAVINVQQDQAQEQAQTQIQRVTVENILEDVDGLMTSPEEKEELRDLVEEYEEELEGDDTDVSRLRQIIAKAREYSDDIARKLVMMATERGVYILLGMSLL